MLMLTGSLGRGARLKTEEDMRILLLLVLFASVCSAQLTGITDTHVHSDPDSIARSIDAIEAARLARDEGMRALLLKNHFAPTVQLAYVVNKVVPGVGVYGGVVLNRAVGGVNAATVEQAATFRGGYAKVVWMPTFDAGNEASPPNRPYVPVSRNGELLPEVLDVLQLVAKHNLALATGHSSAEENLMLIREGRKAGITRIMVTHPVGRMTVEQLREAAAAGAYIELTYYSLLGSGPRTPTPASYAELIKTIGAEHCVLTSDLGREDSPVHTVGWKAYLDLLLQAGISQQEIDLMARRNPARFLDLQ